MIRDAETIVVRTSTKKLLVGKMLESDPKRDLALLSVGAKSCHFLTLGDPHRTSLGQEVFAIGNPVGLTDTVSKGIVSAYRIGSNGEVQHHDYSSSGVLTSWATVDPNLLKSRTFRVSNVSAPAFRAQ